MSKESSGPAVDFAVADFAGLSRPANTLIKKVSNAVGGIFEPYQITRVAKAEAKASLIKAKAEIQITELHRRAVHRLVEEEAKRQKNIEDITEKALPQLKSNSNPHNMEDDWITNFFDKSRIVSDQEMQDLWSRILAGEANAPGTYSKRTVNALSDLDKVGTKACEIQIWHAEQRLHSARESISAWLAMGRKPAAVNKIRRRGLSDF